MILLTCNVTHANTLPASPSVTTHGKFGMSVSRVILLVTVLLHTNNLVLFMRDFTIVPSYYHTLFRTSDLVYHMNRHYTRKIF